MADLARPTITLSYAQTLDGRLATVEGVSQWIGGGESVAYAHALRAQHDAILVGVGTVCADNPRLTVRHVAGRNPLRVVVDSTLRIPLSAAMFSEPGETLIATTGRANLIRLEALLNRGATVLEMPTTEDGRVDLHALLTALAGRWINSVMVEGGATIITALLRAQLADRMAVCIAPRIMGTGLAAVGDLGTRVLANMPTLRDVAIHQYGVDLIVDGRVVYPQRELGGTRV
jgi:5-amino-6-(5-phosphoribosylamino)uracil reductase/diaminohydroxyphosphoribosylaminopyrimidine deaminase/5-amino-6-(5-phosphoribosylamino)uracil reductase